MRLHLFNPDNDLALAVNLDNYTPPKAAAELARAGALLPMWLAGDGDAVLVSAAKDIADADKLKERYGLKAKAVITPSAEVTSCEPWGWSRAVRRRFEAAGVEPGLLPDDIYLDRYRSLSSRLTTLRLAEWLGLEPPVAACDVDVAMAAISRNESRGLGSYLKMPWSCSGRGVFTTGQMSSQQTERRVADIIRSQGYVIVEPDRRRAADFACLYRIEEGRASFHALSLFATDDGGGYRGNLIISDDDIIDRLGVDPMPWAERVEEALTVIAAPDVGHGWAGVDMVVTTAGDIYPMIELNLRCTMGIVAAAMRRICPSPAILSLSAGGIEIREV